MRVELKDDKIIFKVRHSIDGDKLGKIKVNAKIIKSDSWYKEVKANRNSKTIRRQRGRNP